MFSPYHNELKALRVYSGVISACDCGHSVTSGVHAEGGQSPSVSQSQHYTVGRSTVTLETTTDDLTTNQLTSPVIVDVHTARHAAN